MTLLTIGSLEALCAIADLGGVTRAAKKLMLSQSAVSHKIKRLEEALGVEVLSRQAGAQLLTIEGERLLLYGRRILALHDEAVMSIRRQPLTGRIRLGMTEDMANSGLSKILGRFTRLYPQVAVHTSVCQSLQIESQLERGEVDIGVFQLFEHRLRPTDTVLSRDNLHWIKSFELELDSSRPLPYLAFSEDCFFQHWVMEVNLTQSAGFETVLTCSSTAGILSAVISGLGITLMNSHNITARCEIITHSLPIPPNVMYVVRLGSHAKSSAIQALEKNIVDEMKANQSPQ